MLKVEKEIKSWLKKLLKFDESAVSTLLGIAVVIIVGVLLYNYFTRLGKGKSVVPEPSEEVSQEELTKPGEPKPGEVKFTPPSELPAKHKVVKGEHLWSIAQKYYGTGYGWTVIAEENKLVNANVIKEGQELVIPKTEVKTPQAEKTVANSIKSSPYTVSRGDNLWQIAVRACSDGFQWPEIAKANNLINPGLIHQGNQLKIPCLLGEVK